MEYAIRQAIIAYKKNEIPIGAVLVEEGKKIIATAHNMVENKNDPTQHAEKIVIENALRIKKTRYLYNCDLWVTLKPCQMCMGIIRLVRIKRLYYGAENLNSINTANFLNLEKAKKNNKKLEIYSGFSMLECESMLNKFFKNLR